LTRKLITIIAAVTAAIIAPITTTISTAITAAVIAATIPTAAVDTPRLRTIDSAAGRRRRWSIDLAAAAAAVIAAASIPDGTIATGVVDKCFGPRRNGGGSECESCCRHESYPAEFQHHDTSPVICWR
jgi:hypothetical protein